MRFGPFFYDRRKARQDKMFILTLLPYCTSKSRKIQVAKEKKLVALVSVLVAISSPVISHLDLVHGIMLFCKFPGIF